MKAITNIVAFVVLLCLLGANGRHVDGNEYDELPEGEGQADLINRMKDHATQMRHRRRSRQMFPYDYPPPPFYADRRDYNRHQEEYLGQIIRSLDEIVSYLRRTPPPPPPPQPIYIPYPVVQYRPCICRGTFNCRRTGSTNGTYVPTTGTRIAGVDDDNRIWIATPEKLGQDDYDDSDGSRPISFDPIPPKTPTSRPAPPVLHGTDQATQAPAAARPGTCETAILDCCSLSGKAEILTCFMNYKCDETYATNQACRPEVIKRVLDKFKKAYAPVNNNM